MITRPSAFGPIPRVFSVIVAFVIIGILAFSSQVYAQPKADLFLTLFPSSYNVQVRAGKENHVALDVSNYGTVPITRIILSSDVPEGWVVIFEPETLETLGPGSAVRVDVDIRPPSAVSGSRYIVGLVATASEVTASQSIEVLVKPSSYWLWVGMGVAATVVLAFVLVFLRQGRRA
jgi:uncharacterized membrane protein